MSDKKKKILSTIIIICFVIIVIEFILMAGYKLFRERNINRINSLTDIVKEDNHYIAVGMSDFHNSHFINEMFYDHTNTTTKRKENIIATQARIAKYDENYKVLWENTIKAKYDSAFYSVLADDDGYVAVGSYVSKYEQLDNDTRDAIIVKYDKTGKMMWKNTYSVLSDTEFFKVIKDGDDYVAIGQSIYENFEVGTHITGGGIIVRYNKKGEELAHNNYGGNKSGSFNDIISVDDGFIVCGKDAVNFGIVLKFSKDFGRDENDTGLISKKVIWDKSYSNTDNAGFSSMALVNNTLYVVGAVNVSKDKDSEGNTLFKYDAGIAKYNLNGDYLGTFTLGEDTHHRFNSVTASKDTLYLSLLLDVDSYYDGAKENTDILKFDLANEKILDRYSFKGDNDFVINRIVNFNNKYMVVGTTNNSCTIRGCDYKPIINYYDKIKK